MVEFASTHKKIQKQKLLDITACTLDIAFNYGDSTRYSVFSQYREKRQKPPGLLILGLSNRFRGTNFFLNFLYRILA